MEYIDAPTVRSVLVANPGKGTDQVSYGSIEESLELFGLQTR